MTAGSASSTTTSRRSRSSVGSGKGSAPRSIVCGVGLVVALIRRTRADLILSSFVIVYFADLLTLSAHFDRYVLPLVPALGALAGRMRSLAPVTLLLLVVPLTWSIRDTKELTRTDTRDRRAALGRAAHRVAGRTSQRIRRRPAFAGLQVLPLLLPGPKRGFDPNRDVARLRRLGIRDVVVTGAVTDRVLAARDRYPREARFYDDLRDDARSVLLRRARQATSPGPGSRSTDYARRSGRVRQVGPPSPLREISSPL